ncbi:MAG: cytochrome c oxidase subunit 3 family protein [Deltaproteobacteria bacterium]|nr:cytochrome c oxidase subunit 3 family protein [Deltaproteobacteria bacterium]
MWVFLVQEIMFFSGLFLTYAAYRYAHAGAFAHASHHLDVTLGTINTVVLIGSSLTMALAVHSAQMGQRRPLVTFLFLTLVLGSVFLAIKSVEYGHKFEEGLIPGPWFMPTDPDAAEQQLFFSLYFAMTGMHALHMIIGAVALIYLIVKSAAGRYTSAYYTPIEMFGLYWHFVDIVWIFLFPLLYLFARH